MQAENATPTGSQKFSQKLAEPMKLLAKFHFVLMSLISGEIDTFSLFAFFCLTFLFSLDFFRCMGGCFGLVTVSWQFPF